MRPEAFRMVNEARVEVPLSARQVKFIAKGDGRTRFQTAAIVCRELFCELLSEHLFDEFAGYLCTSEAHRLLLGRIEPHELETEIRRDINQEHAYRDVV